MPGIHARLSPSSAERWMVCPGSVALVESLPAPAPSSFFADEGTAAHEVRALALELGVDVGHFLGMPIEVNGTVYTVTEEMVEALQPGIDEIREIPGELHVECKVDLSSVLVQGQFGTLDAAIYEWKTRTLYINDLKYGRGVPVSPIKNRQLLLYALGFIHTFIPNAPIDRVVLWIDQPRHPAGGGRYELPLKELLLFGHEAEAAAQAVYAPDAVIVPGEAQCQWCPARAICAPFALWNLETLRLAFSDLSADAPLPYRLGGLTPQERTSVILRADTIVSWLQALEKAAYDDALAGRPCPGLKLVYGRMGTRKWKDEQIAEATLVVATDLEPNQIHETRLMSPAQVEKLLPKKERIVVSILVSREDPKLILVPESDKREAQKSNKDAFADLDATDFGEKENE